jgi:hypothetical protein
MPALQDVIHKIEVGEWTRHVKVGVALLGFIALAAVYNIWHFKDFSTPEAMDTAQLARNISRGKGFTTQFIRPLSLHLIQKHLAENGKGNRAQLLKTDHPDLANAPVYPLILAGLMKVAPVSYDISKANRFVRFEPEVLIAALNQVLFFMAVLLVFRLGQRLFDPTVAWVSSIMFAATDLYWKFSVSGLSTMLLVVLFLLLAWCLVALEESQREGVRSPAWFIAMAVLTGLLVGVGALTRYSFVCLLLPVVAYFLLFFGQRRAVLSVSAALACAALVTPWLVRNYNLSGMPLGTTTFAIYQETNPNPEFRGTKLERYYNGDFEVALSKIGVDQFLRKLVVNTAEIMRHDLLSLGGNWVAAFFLIGVLVPFLNPGLNRLRGFLLLCLVAMIMTQALGKGH